MALSNDQIALALARAILPGGEVVPAVDASLVERARELIASSTPSLLPAWKWLHSAIDMAAITQTGRRFSQLDEERRMQVVARWQVSSPLRMPLQLVSLIYKLLHFDTAAVHTAMGGRERSPVRSLEQPRWLERVHRAAEWESGDIECDVVVVGTGAGGAFAGRELAERGHAVVFVEQGEHLRRDVFNGSSMEAHRRFLRMSFAVGNAVIPIFSGELVGGSTAVNGGTCFRTPAWILDDWCERLGTDEFSPDRMDPYFNRVEQALEVAPSMQREVGPIRDVVTRGCDHLGWSHFAIRRNVRDCKGGGFCHFGCPTDARRSTNLSAIPDALRRGAMLFTEAKVEQVLVEGGRAVGVMAIARDGRKIRVHARSVVLATGALATPLILLRQGLCNGSGQLGRNLTLHPSAGVSGLMDEEVNGHRFIPQGYGCDEFLRDGELIMAAQPDINVSALLFSMTGRPLMQTLDVLPRIASLAVLIRDAAPTGRIWRDVGGRPLITYRVTDEDRTRLHSATVHAMELLLAAGARRLYPTLSSSPMVEPQHFARFRRERHAAADYALASYHPLGTCRMGKDPRQNVVGLDHEAHDVKRLYIVDGSTVPGAPGVNPQLTIMSMAMRAAERIHDALGRATSPSTIDQSDAALAS